MTLFLLDVENKFQRKCTEWIEIWIEVAKVNKVV